MTQMAMPNQTERKAHKVHKKLQATVEIWEQERWPSPRKSALISGPVPHSSESMHTSNVAWTEQVIVRNMYAYKHTYIMK